MNESDVKMTESDKMWEEIKNLPISMFALPNQVVADHVTRVPLSPSELHLKMHSSAVIASLDVALNTRSDGFGNTQTRHRFDIELTKNDLVIVKRANVDVEKVVEKVKKSVKKKK